MVLSNPPGRKSSLTMVGADGHEAREDREIERQDFAVTTSNKEINFVQHIATNKVSALYSRASSGSTGGPRWCCRTTSCLRAT